MHPSFGGSWAVDKDLESLGFKGFNRPLEKEWFCQTPPLREPCQLDFLDGWPGRLRPKSHEAVMESGRDIG